MTNTTSENLNNETPLESWKEIAAYLQRDVTTAMRWEKHEGLPVHRHHHQSRSSVYAYPSELDAWRANRAPAAETTHAWWWPVPAFASTIIIAMSLMMVGSGPYAGSLVQAADGIVTRQVWKADLNFDGAPSPDGSYLAVDDESGNLAVRDLVTGEVWRLTSDAGGWQYATAPVFSPDAKWVAFGWLNGPDTCELRVAAMDGSEPRVLFQAEGQEVAPAYWSRDGSHILALRRRPVPYNHVDIVSVSSTDGQLTVLKRFDKGPEPDWRRLRFSPDGRFVAYDLPVDKAGNRDIFVLSIAGGQVSPLVQHPARDQLLGWTPDGKSVVLLSDRTGSWGAWLVPVAGGKPQGELALVKRDAGAMEPMGFARDGSFFYKVRDDGLNIYGATLDGGAPSLLVERHLGWNFRSAWSPDGKKLAYLSRRWRGSDSATLCIRSLESREERDYSSKLKDLRWLQWSPGGSSLLVRGKGGLYMIDTGTEAVTRVPWWPPREYGSYMIDPCWSADEKAVYYVEPRVLAPGGRTRLVRTDLATGREVVIHQFPEEITYGAVLPSPDGRWFLFWLGRGAGWSPAVMRADGTDIRDLPGPWTPPQVVSRTLTWSPDSKQVVFIKHPGTPAERTTSELWGVPAEGGEQRSLGFSVANDVQFPVSIHPDGKRLAFTAWEPATEVWVMESFLPLSSQPEEQGGK